MNDPQKPDDPVSGWHVDIVCALDVAALTESQQERLTDCCHGTVLDAAAGAARLTFEQDEESPAEAVTAALAQALRALTQAETSGRVTEVECLAADVYLERALTPDITRFLDLVGVSETAAILGVTTSRIPQLARDHADFPKPVASPSSGRVYYRSSIEAFNSTWTRKRTGRPPGDD